MLHVETHTIFKLHPDLKPQAVMQTSGQADRYPTLDLADNLHNCRFCSEKHETSCFGTLKATTLAAFVLDASMRYQREIWLVMHLNDNDQHGILTNSMSDDFYQITYTSLETYCHQLQ